MNKPLASTIAAIALWTAACGVSIDSDDASDDRSSDAAVVDELAVEDWEDDFEDDLSSDQVDESEVYDPSDSSDTGVVEDDGGTDDPGYAPSVPASSGGATPGTYVAPDGGVQNGYGLRFEVSEDGAMIHSLEADVLESCEGSSTTSTVTVGPGLSWDIVDGRFSTRYEEDYDGVTVYTTLEGSFSGTTATGTIRQESVVAGSVCDTYALDFTAQLT